MNIAVCVKHIPDPNVPPEMDGKYLKREGVQGVLDPGDEFGVEAALQLKESQGGEVTLVSMGPGMTGHVQGLERELAVACRDRERVALIDRDDLVVVDAGLRSLLALLVHLEEELQRHPGL